MSLAVAFVGSLNKNKMQNSKGTFITGNPIDSEQPKLHRVMAGLSAEG